MNKLDAIKNTNSILQQSTQISTVSLNSANKEIVKSTNLPSTSVVLNLSKSSNSKNDGLTYMHLKKK